MKQVLLSLLMISMAGTGPFNSMHVYNGKPVEIRSGEWPIMLQRHIEQADTTYSLQFRDAQVLSSAVMDTLPFPNLSQLRYFEKALTTLKTGTNGDIARFKDYSITRAEKKYEGTWYILKFKWGLTDFRQSEADLMINTIRDARF